MSPTSYRTAPPRGVPTTIPICPRPRQTAQATFASVPTAAIRDITVHYEVGGDGPRTLFLNGSGATLESIAPLIEVLRSRVELLAHDQRGLGRTTVPTGPATMADYASDAIGLLDHVGWDSCGVVGISFGGMVAQELAVSAPERVDRLALLCTSPGGPDFASFPLHELAELDPDERRERGALLLDTRFDAAWLASHDADRALADTMAERTAAPSDPEVARGEAIQLEARRGHDVIDRLDRITCPTFVAAGRYDGIAPLSNSEAIARLVPDADLHVYEGGHAFLAQDAAAIPDLLGFLGGG